jgi:hypothetical protein
MSPRGFATESWRSLVILGALTRKVSGIILTAGVIGLSWGLALGGARAADCPPVAIVRGPSEIVASIRAILRAHEVATAVGSCPDHLVRVTLFMEPGSRSYVLHIEDPFGRTSERRIGDAETAASLIESWALPAADDLPAPPPRPTALRRTAEAQMPSPAPIDASRWRLAGALEVAGGSDDSLWYGAALTGCRSLAALCVGGRLRVARDDSLVGPDRDVGRSATELLMLAALPLAGRVFTLTPMVGVGAGWIHSATARPEGEVATPSSDDLGVRVEVAASAGLALGPHLSLVGEIGASRGWSLASTRREVAGGAAVNLPAGYVRAAVACQYAP